MVAAHPDSRYGFGSTLQAPLPTGPESVIDPRLSLPSSSPPPQGSGHSEAPTRGPNLAQRHNESESESESESDDEDDEDKDKDEDAENDEEDDNDNDSPYAANKITAQHDNMDYANAAQYAVNHADSHLDGYGLLYIFIQETN
jgi:hypothetical protein